MDHTDYTTQKIKMILDEIHTLSRSDFPHPDAQEALSLLEKLFKADLLRIARAVEAGNSESRASASAQAGSHIVCFLPILGFCLRSTNVRNSFELFIPLLQLSRQLLARADARLILSSEWDFSPFTYPLVFPELPNFVLIGLPVPESENALIIPLSGHELGHSVWKAYGLREKMTPKIQTGVINALKNEWAAFESLYQSKYDINNVESDFFIRQVWLEAFNLSIRQIEEIFCDCIGVRVFGEGYFHATEYLISPHFENRRAPQYPDIETRMNALVAAAMKFGQQHPQDFAQRFSEKKCNLSKKEEQILLLADAATKEAINDAIAAVEAIAAHTSLPFPNSQAAATIYNCFKIGIPAHSLENLADIINAGWQAYFDQNFPKPNSSAQDRFRHLNELVLKTLEVMEFEIRMKVA